MHAKTAQALFMLKNRVAGNRVAATVADAADLLCTLAPTSCSSSSSASGLLDEMRHRTTLTKRLLLLDGAVDRCTSERLLSLREEGRCAGVALVSDESPPSQPRLRGLRFQITVFIGEPSRTCHSGKPAKILRSK
jgi:hypothetical protein